jgi:hypothetical protein
MRLLAHSGRRAEAIRVHSGIAAALHDELGLAPGPEITAVRNELIFADPTAQPLQLDSSASVSAGLSGVLTVLLCEPRVTSGDAQPVFGVPHQERPHMLARVSRCIEDCGGAVLRSRSMGHHTIGIFARVSLALSAAKAICNSTPVDDDKPPVYFPAVAVHCLEADLRNAMLNTVLFEYMTRLLAMAQAGQTIVSQAATQLAWDVLPAALELLPLGPCLVSPSRGVEEVYELREVSSQREPLEPAL